jgi:hypothetical protein
MLSRQDLAHSGVNYTQTDLDERRGKVLDWCVATSPVASPVITDVSTSPVITDVKISDDGVMTISRILLLTSSSFRCSFPLCRAGPAGSQAPMQPIADAVTTDIVITD